METLLTWLDVDYSDHSTIVLKRTAMLAKLPNGMWLVELGTPTRPCCPARSFKFEEAIALAIKAAGEE